MERYPKMVRFGSLILAAVVATLTLSVVVHATQVITTPNAAFFTYSLAPGANSAPVTPVANQSVLVMGVQTASGYRGTGHVTLLHVPSSFLEWVGLESPSGAAITSGFSGTAGTHIVFLDFIHSVDIQVNTPDTFRIHNANTITMTGNVTLIW
jgi:hypothetical protein